MKTKIIVTVDTQASESTQLERRVWEFDNDKGEYGRDKFEEITTKLLRRDDIDWDSRHFRLSENYFRLPLKTQSITEVPRTVSGSFIFLP